MKKLLLLFVSLLFSYIIYAQSYDLQHIITQINTQTDLTDEQRMEIVSLSASYYPKAMEIQNSTEKDEVKLVKAFALKKQIDGDLKDILTSKQYKQYQAMCDEYEKKYLRK